MDDALNRTMEDIEAGRRWYTGTEILNLPELEDMWLIDRLLPRKGLAGLTGPSDTGKSTLARQLGITIATGQKTFLGRAINAKHNRVAYVSTEDGETGVKDFMAKQIQYFGVNKCDNMHFFFGTENVIGELDKFLKETPVDLVIIDVWADTFEGNSNLMTDVRKNLKEYQRISRIHDCLILFILHNVKNSEKTGPDKNKTNGSQSIEAKLRVLLEIRKVDDIIRELTITKANYLSDQEKKKPIRLKLLDDHMVMELAGAVGQGSSATDPTAGKYDKEMWQKRFNAHKAIDHSKSTAAIRKALVEEYGEENVPGSTWFKTHMKTEVTTESDEVEDISPQPDEEIEHPRHDDAPLYFLF